MKARKCLTLLALVGLLAGPVLPQPETKERIPVHVNPGDGNGFIVELNPNFDDPACQRCLQMMRKGTFKGAKVLRVRKAKLDEVHVQPVRPSGLKALPPRTKWVNPESRLAYLVGDQIVVALGPNPALNQNKQARFLGAIMNEDWLRAVPANGKPLIMKNIDFLMR